MNDLISRSEAIEALNQHSYETFSDYDTTVELLNELPSIEAVPVVHAKWIKHYIKIGNFDWKYKCSMCGKFNKQYSPPYCPHCGAKMDVNASDSSKEDLDV